MSQFPGDKGSEFLAGTLGGPGYGEFPLGSPDQELIQVILVTEPHHNK